MFRERKNVMYHVIQTVVSYCHRNILKVIMVVTVILVENRFSKLINMCGYPVHVVVHVVMYTV